MRVAARCVYVCVLPKAWQAGSGQGPGRPVCWRSAPMGHGVPGRESGFSGGRACAGGEPLGSGRSVLLCDKDLAVVVCPL